MPNQALVITPTYNEKDNLPELVKRVLALPVKVDMLIVDDNSPDGTGALADEIAASDARVHVMHRPGKLGLGTAYLDGFRWALDRDVDEMRAFDASQCLVVRRTHRLAIARTGNKSPGFAVHGYFDAVVDRQTIFELALAIASPLDAADRCRFW